MSEWLHSIVGAKKGVCLLKSIREFLALDTPLKTRTESDDDQDDEDEQKQEMKNDNDHDMQ